MLAGCGLGSLETGIPEVTIILDAGEFSRAALTNTATISFVIANAGPGTAYFEGCPDPVSIVLHRLERGVWIEEQRRNLDCVGELPTEMTLESDQGYAYSLLEDTPGRYQLQVRFGSDPDARLAHQRFSPEFDVQ